MLIMSRTNGTIIPKLPSQDFPLNVFLQNLSKKLTEDEFEDLKFLCQGKGGIRKGDMSRLRSTLDLFTILLDREIITTENLLTLQAMIWHIGRKDVYKEFVRFCEQLDNTLYFFEAPEKAEDEQEHVKFHVKGYKCMTNLYELRGAVSKILCCPEKYVIIRGIEQSNSLWITFMIPDWCIDIILCLSIKSWKVLEALSVDKILIQSVKKEIVCPFNISENVTETEHEEDTDTTLGVDIDLNSATISVSESNNQSINKREGGIYSHEDEPQEKVFEEIRKFWSNREDQTSTATGYTTSSRRADSGLLGTLQNHGYTVITKAQYVLHGHKIFQKAMYAQIGGEVILSCQVSEETSTKIWRKSLTVVTRGSEINRNILGHERLKVIIDRGFYNLRIHNITKDDYSTYWCETQQGNSAITVKGTKLIHSVIVASTVNPNEETSTDRQRTSFQSTLIDSSTSEIKDGTDSEFQRLSFQSTMSDLATSETKDSTGIYVGQTFYIGLFTTGFAVLCLSVGCNCFINKYKITIAIRKERSSDDNDHQEDALQADGTNNTTVNEIAAEEKNENEISHYEMINENEMIEMFHPTTSQHLSNLPRASNIFQTLHSDNIYLEVIEDINNQKLDPSTKMNRDEDQVSILKGSHREERNTSIFIFPTKNEKDGSSNTIHKESVVTIEANNFEDCKTSYNSISVSSSSSEQSADESIQERDTTAYEYLSQYTSLNVNDMEYLNSYSTPITKNKLRKSGSQNSNTSECPGRNEQYYNFSSSNSQTIRTRRSDSKC